MSPLSRLTMFGLIAVATSAACAVTGFIGSDFEPDASPTVDAPVDAVGDAGPKVDAADTGADRYVNVSGDYVLAVTAVKNECGFSGWDDASVATVPVKITQNGTEVRALLADLVGLPTLLLLGSNEYVGTADGDRLSLRIDGSAVATVGACTVVYDGIIDARYVDGGGLTGNVRYVRVFRSGDCTGLTCENLQAFDGGRATDGGSGG
jgi:hypothetical protein